MKKINIRKVLLLLIAVLVIYSGSKFFLNFGSGSGKIDEFASLKFIFNEKKAQSPLSKIVSKSLEGAKGDYAIAIKNLKTNENFYLNEHKSFKTGSLYKLWIMATVFDRIKNGDFKEDEILSNEVSVLNDKYHIPADIAELKEGSIALSVKDALYQMITISHNYAAFLLTDKVKLSTVKEYIGSNGFDESDLGGDLPTTSAYDMEAFFGKLYRGEFTDKDSTEQMLLLLKQQKLNNKLPKLLPQNTIIAHKTGELDLFTHDAGIVYTAEGDYIIVVLSESDIPSGAEARIADISKAVYEYFTR